MPRRSQGLAKRVVVFVQENKTADFYFPSLAGWGADVTAWGRPSPTAPDFDQPHDRNAWVHYAMGDYPAVQLSIDNDSLIPYYSLLAKTFTFCDHHFGAGTDSTAGHLLTFTGQTPTFKNPPFTGPAPVWDVPTVFGLAGRAGRSWGAFADQNGYPTKLTAELNGQAAQGNVHGPGDFIKMAHAGTLPELCYVWSPAGFDEHPPAHRGTSPDYLTKGQDLVWQEVDAVVTAKGWPDTVFVLTWDDWGGYADHVATPAIETLPDALHPGGFQAIGGSRLPLIMFGATVAQGVESQWHSHASVAKTVIDLLGLPPMGVPRVDEAPSLVHRVDAALSRPAPPSYGSPITQPPAPQPAPVPASPDPWPGALDRPMPPILLNGGGTLPPPSDGVVRSGPPHLPAGAPSPGRAQKGRPTGRSRSTAPPRKAAGGTPRGRRR